MARRITKMDIAVVIILATLTAFSVWAIYFAPFIPDKGKTAAVYTDSGTEKYKLSDDAVYNVTSNGIEIVIKIEDGSVMVDRSDCPDEICVHTGKISRPGASIICVPAHLRIEIEGEADGSADYTVG